VPSLACLAELTQPHHPGPPYLPLPPIPGEREPPAGPPAGPRAHWDHSSRATRDAPSSMGASGAAVDVQDDGNNKGQDRGSRGGGMRSEMGSQAAAWLAAGGVHVVTNGPAMLLEDLISS
jgi:hypothetical protein